MLRKAKNIKRRFSKQRDSTSDCETSDEDHVNQPFLMKVDAPIPSCQDERFERDMKFQLDFESSGQLRRSSMDSSIEAHSQPPKGERHITFELPVTPQRSKSPSVVYPKARSINSLSDDELTLNTSRFDNSLQKPRRSSWSLFSSSTEHESTTRHHIPIVVGTRVSLRLRPLPTFGYVRYIGPVDFAEGEQIGVELDYGVGNCDGSIQGKRYFQTDGKRGIFLRRLELEGVQENEY